MNLQRHPERSRGTRVGGGAIGPALRPPRSLDYARDDVISAFTGAVISLGKHKLRTSLTMLGMVFGVGAVIALRDPR